MEQIQTHLEPLNDNLAVLTVKKYCCSACWSDLVRHPASGRQWYVLCRKCGEETPGYVTKYFADNRREESQVERLEVRDMLTGLGVIENPHAGKSTEQLLQELGF